MKLIDHIKGLWFSQDGITDGSLYYVGMEFEHLPPDEYRRHALSRRRAFARFRWIEMWPDEVPYPRTSVSHLHIDIRTHRVSMTEIAQRGAP